jgi:hypothetical protein
MGNRIAKKCLIGLLIFLVVSMAYGANQAPNDFPKLTSLQAQGLTNCLNGSAMAVQLALAKQRGMTAEAAEKMAPSKDFKLIAEKVWSENFPSPLDYGKDFYERCSGSYIDVHSGTFSGTLACADAGFIASVSDSERVYHGATKATMYSYFSTYTHDAILRNAIDVAFEPHATNGGLMDETFNNCLAPMVRK